MTEWRPSHRRSEETGEIQSTFKERKGDDVSDVAVVEPEIYAAPEPVSVSRAEAAELLRWTCAALEGPDKSAVIRIAALRRAAGIDRTSLREAARKLHCSPDTLARAVQAIQAGIKSNTFREVRR